MMVRALWILVLALAGCLHAASETCANGAVCPAGFLCVDTAHTTPGSQLCAASTCGNGKLDPGEFCDDGNNKSGDGCPADCGPPCGDGVLDPGEVCDDGNNVDGDGCSADCQTLDHKFDVSPAAVNLTATEGDALADPTAVTVRLELAGDSVLVGYPPGVAEPSWLSITEAAPSDHTIELALRATDTLTVGEHSTSVRLTLGHASSTSTESLDLPVTYTVQPSDLAITASPAALAFTAFADDVFVPAQTVALTFNGDPVTVASAPPWLTVTAASPTTFTATVSNTAFAAGTALAGDIVFATTRELLQRTASVHVDAQILAPPALAITTAPTAVTFTAFTSGALPAPQPLAVTFTGATVQLASLPPPWLTVTAPAAPGPSPATFTLAANTTVRPAGSEGVAELVFRTARAGQHEDTTVRVEYDVLAVPEVRYVAPYVGLANRGGSLFIRGRGFQTGTPLTVAIGDLRLGPLTPDNDTQITVRYPPLPVGRYPVTLVDPPGVAPNAPALVITDPPAFGAQVIETGGFWRRLVFDAERQMIYGIDTRNQQIGRFAYANGAWSALAPATLPALVDAVMAPDGGSLIAIKPSELDELSLRDGLFTPVPRLGPPSDPFCNVFIGIAIPDHGTAFLLAGATDSTIGCNSYAYDLLDHTFAPSGVDLANTIAEASGDGSTIYANTTNEMSTYDARTAATAAADFFDLAVAQISVSGDGTRAVVSDLRANPRVFDRALNLLATFATPGAAAFISRDATRAFVFAQDPPGPRIDIYDLTTAVSPAPLLRSIALPTTPDEFGLGVQITTNLDDTTVFVGGRQRLLVVPVSP
jgi:cysteine-rich repeat protein